MDLEIDSDTGYLPPGVHNVGWSDVVRLCGGNTHRLKLLDGLRSALINLRAAGCLAVLLDGSFVSLKALPNDYDGAWETKGVDPNLIDIILLTFSNGRAAMKAKYGGELFPASLEAAPGVLYSEFFQSDRDGNQKGVLMIDLRSIT